MKTSSPSLAGAAFSEAQDEALTNALLSAKQWVDSHQMAPFNTTNTLPSQLAHSLAQNVILESSQHDRLSDWPHSLKHTRQRILVISSKLNYQHQHLNPGLPSSSLLGLRRGFEAFQTEFMQVRQHHQKEQQVAAMTTARVLSNKGDCDQALDAAAIPNSFLLEPPAIAAALDPSEYEEENNNNVPCLMMLDD